MSRYPKYLNKVMLTKQKIADYEYTVLYDRQGNKYLKLETLGLTNPPKVALDVDPTVSLGDVHMASVLWGRRS